MPLPAPPDDHRLAAGDGVAVELAILHDGAGGLIYLLTDRGGLALQARTPMPAGGLAAALSEAGLPPALRALLIDEAGPPGAALRLLLDPSLPGAATLPAALAGAPGRGLAGRWALACQEIAGSAPPPADDDVRQLTVLSVDLAGSTDLMHRLGDEVYSERLLQYHRCVAQCIAAQGGRADDPQGDDGFMGYFGYPVAHEDAVARALRAALALAAALREIDLPVRLGVSTGRVVIRQGQPVGAAVHHAARLQAMAATGTVLVGAATRRIAGERFGFELFNAAARLKGFDEAGAVWRLCDERPVLGSERFDRRGDLSPFVGRAAELQRLQRHWQAASAAQRQVLRLVGEAGIGKSRLVHEFRQWLAAQGHRTLECRCAPEHSGSAFQPLIDLMRRRLQMHEGDEPALQLARLRQLQVTSGPAADEALALLGALLSLPPALLPPLPRDESAESRRRRTMALLERVALGLSDNAPVCLIVEDLQWVDPSTGELIQRLIDGPPAQRVLLLLTERRAEGDDGAASAGPTLRLAGLDGGAARALLGQACGATPLDAALTDWLAERADGVPLFIEESARLAAALAAQQPGADLARRLRDAVPGTLRDLLAARLDLLPQARRAAQLGSALGRSFPRALIEAVQAHPGLPFRLGDLAARLDTLVHEGLLSLHDEGGQPVYAFRHALLRDAAYQSLLGRDRRALHASIAAVLQADFAALVASQPALLAQHHEQAGQLAEALAGWERAARHAAARSAQQEAIGHLQRALALLAGTPDHAGRGATELRLQLLLAGRLMASAGYGAAPVQAVYERALALAEAIGDTAALHKVRLGLEGWHFMRGDFARAQAMADAMAAGLGAAPDPLARIQARWARANLLFHQGRVAQALALTEACLADYHALPRAPHAVQDPGVIALCYAAWAHWVLGDAERALHGARQALALAERLEHAFGIGQALGFLAVVHHFRGETEAGLGAARRAIEVCRAGGFGQWLAHAQVLHGRLRLAQGEVAEGLDEMARGHAMWAATGAVVTLPFYLALRAEGLAAAGRPVEALPLLAEAQALIDRHGERHYEAEVLRLHGELLLAAGHGAGAAEPWLQGALAVAREQQLPGLVRRCAESLARLRAAPA
ncbi:MAG: AAA family ATPase [Burkholderiaceae bacterium]|nr:AAA family ATPase [Burkholderiaceae bacterium]